MSPTWFLILFIGLVILALVLIRFANHRRYKSQIVNKKISQLLRRMDELEELAIAMESLCESTDIAQEINQELIDLIDVVKKLTNENEAIQLRLTNAQNRIQDLTDPTYNTKLHRVLNSDASIAKAQYFISEAARIIVKHQKQGRLDESRKLALIAELRWSHLMTAILSIVAQGYRANAAGAEKKAHAFYTSAIQKLHKSSSQDTRQAQLTHELEELLAGERKFLSRNLMPEGNDSFAASAKTTNSSNAHSRPSN